MMFSWWNSSLFTNENIPEDVVWIDDAFYIKKTRFGLHTSILKEPYGAHFITGMQYEDV